jgi:hypothetical protein
VSELENHDGPTDNETVLTPTANWLRFGQAK